MLGFLHKRVLGKCHPGVMAILPFARSDVQADCNSKVLHSFGDIFKLGFDSVRSLHTYISIIVFRKPWLTCHL